MMGYKNNKPTDGTLSLFLLLPRGRRKREKRETKTTLEKRMLFDPKRSVTSKDGLTLLKAADLIENSKLLKFERGDELDPSGGFCLIGAISYALSEKTFSGDAGELEAVRLTVEVGRAMGFEPTIGSWSSPANAAVDWNNAPERTKEEVVDAIRLAAYKLQENHNG